MKTLINKNNPQIRITLVNKQNPAIMITAPEIIEYIGGYEIAGIAYCAKELWTLVEEEPQLPANLDEAAEDAQQDLYGGFYSGHIEAYQEAFKRGARWMAEQIKGGSK